MSTVTSPILLDETGQTMVTKLNDIINAIDNLDVFSGNYADLEGLPTLGTASALDVAASGNASSSQVVKGNDTRLTDARPSSDVVQTYNASSQAPISGKGVAEAIETVVPTKEISGSNPIEFSDGADAPLVKCTTAIQGNQDLHGYDKPWVGGAGKNKLGGEFSDGTSAGVTFKVNSNGVISTTNTSTGYAYIESTPFDLAAGEYIFSGVPSGNTKYLLVLYVGGTVFSSISNGSTVTFTISETTTMKARCVINGEGVSTGVDFKPMLRLSTVQDATFEPYSNICPITAYTEGKIEVRGKNLWNEQTKLGYYSDSTGAYTSVSGQLCSDSMIPVSPSTSYRFVKPNTLGDVLFYDESQTYISAVLNVPANGAFATPNNCRYININLGNNYGATYNNDVMIEEGSSATPYEPYTSTTHTTTYPSAIYRGSEDVVNGTVEKRWGVVVFDGSVDEQWSMYGSGSASAYAMQITISDVAQRKISATDRFIIANYLQTINTDATWGNFDAFISRETFGTKIVIGIKSITTIEDLRTYLASNNLVVAYELATPTASSVTPTNLPIKSLFGYNHIESTTGDLEVEYITEGEQAIVDLIERSQHVYSTQEQVVGTWIDGSVVYEKTISQEMTLNQNWQQYFSTSGIDTIVDVVIRTRRASEECAPAFSKYAIASWLHRNGYINVSCEESDWKILSMTIRYTKATTQTRSLSRGGEELTKGEPIEEKEPEEVNEK